MASSRTLSIRGKPACIVVQGQDEHPVQALFRYEHEAATAIEDDLVRLAERLLAAVRT